MKNLTQCSNTGRNTIQGYKIKTYREYTTIIVIEGGWKWVSFGVFGDDYFSMLPVFLQ